MEVYVVTADHNLIPLYSVSKKSVGVVWYISDKMAEVWAYMLKFRLITNKIRELTLSMLIYC